MSHLVMSRGRHRYHEFRVGNRDGTATVGWHSFKENRGGFDEPKNPCGHDSAGDDPRYDDERNGF
jgi:hypothetical protein